MLQNAIAHHMESGKMQVVSSSRRTNLAEVFSIYLKRFQRNSRDSQSAYRGISPEPAGFTGNKGAYNRSEGA
jgi:hypothetical protein